MISFDPRSHGRSTVTTDGNNYATQAADLAKLLESDETDKHDYVFCAACSNVLGLRSDAIESFWREMAVLKESGHRGELPPAEFLAISGGGDTGAFGAGLLNGWTATGQRPVLTMRPAPIWAG